MALDCVTWHSEVIFNLNAKIGLRLRFARYDLSCLEVLVCGWRIGFQFWKYFYENIFEDSMRCVRIVFCLWSDVGGRGTKALDGGGGGARFCE